MRPDSLAVIGLGAMGGSVAWQARRAGVARVVGCTRSPADGVQALKLGAVHDLAESPETAVSGADMVVLATPPQAMPALLGAVARASPAAALVTDIASIKLPVMRWAAAAGLERRFAGSHPFVGTHLEGWHGATPDLFRGALVYVVDSGAVGEAAAREVMDFWRTVMEAEPVRIAAGRHDDQLGWTSHLPQVAAGALARVVGGREAVRGATWGKGIRDATRIAAGSPEAWVDVLLLNREPVLEGLAALEGDLGRFRELLRAGDREGLLGWLARAASVRRAVDAAPDQRGAVVDPDAPR